MSLYKAMVNPFTGNLQLVSGDSAFHMKESVATYNDLPIASNNENDVRITQDTDLMYTWSISASSGNVSDWLQIGSASLVDWSAITNKPSSAVADIDDAVSKRHTQDTDVYIDNYTSTELYVDGNRADSYTANGTITKPFKTIQSAIDSVSDASEAKRYIVLIVGGKTYEEQITLKSYVYLRSNKQAIIKNTGGSTIIASGSGSQSMRLENLIVQCYSDNEDHGSLHMSGTANVSLYDCLLYGNAINGSSPTGAEGLKMTSGTIMGSNSTFQGWNWALNMSSGFVSLDICLFAGYINDVQRTGGTLQLGLSKFSSGGVVGSYTLKYGADVIDNDSSVTGATVKDALNNLLEKNSISGSFTTVDGKTINVVDGQITSIV